MMLNSVSNVRFCANENPVEPNPTSSYDLGRAGAFSNPNQGDSVEISGDKEGGKKSSTGKKIAKFLGGVVVVAGVLAALKKFNVVKVLETTEGATIMQKIGHYTAKAGEAVSKYSGLNWVIGKFTPKA